MSIISWNCRGLGNLQTVRALEKVVNKEEPDIVFLMETKVDKKEWIDKVKERCKLKHGVFVSSNGNSGGLALFWKDGVTLDVQSYAYDHIDAWIDGGSGIGWWHLTGFYGNPETNRRPESWAKLKFLKNSSSLPWLVIGDFNEIIGLSEKEGGHTRPKRQMELFLEVINFCALKDLGYVGPKFTWLFQQRDGFQIRERLDRALGSSDWLVLFPRASLHHLSSLISDHSPLSLHLKSRPCKRSKRRLF